jgi:hypothetical protein
MHDQWFPQGRIGAPFALAKTSFFPRSRTAFYARRVSSPATAPPNNASTTAIFFHKGPHVLQYLRHLVGKIDGWRGIRRERQGKTTTKDRRDARGSRSEVRRLSGSQTSDRPFPTYLTRQAFTLSQSRRTRCGVHPVHPWSPGPADIYHRTHG